MILALLLAAQQSLLVAAVPQVAMGQEQIPAADRETIAKLARLVSTPARSGSREAFSVLKAGLLNPSPVVRANAARVAHVLGGRALSTELRTALKAEADPQAISELAWAVGDVDLDRALAPIFQGAWTRSGFNEAVAVAGLAATPFVLYDLWPILRNAVEDKPELAVRAVTRSQSPFLPGLIAKLALTEGRRRVYRALVLEGPPVESEVLESGTTSEVVDVRVAAYLGLAALESSSRIREGSNGKKRRPPESADESAALFLLGRAWETPGVEPFASVLAALRREPPAAARFAADLRMRPEGIRSLSSAEQMALLTTLGWTREDALETIEASMDATPQTSQTFILERAAPKLKIMSGWPRGMIESVLAERCVGRPGGFQGIEARYSVGNERRLVPLRSTRSTTACRDEALILGANVLDRDGDPHVLLVLPERPEYIACQKAGLMHLPLRAGVDVARPQKVLHVEPLYPESAKQREEEGTVTLEAVISEIGCPVELRVTRNVSPALDLEAIDAVVGWRYEPVLVNGVPMPVRTTINVTFKR